MNSTLPSWKKILLSFNFVGLLLLNQNCNKSEATTLRIDYTQSYEDAALALASAQENYQKAVATNDPIKIEKAKKELEDAHSKYETSKSDYISSGGTAKAEYEYYLTTSQQTLSSAESQAGKATSTVTEKVNTIVETNAALQEKAEDVKTKIDSKVTAEKAKISEAKTKVKENTDKIKASSEEAKTKINRSKSDLNSLLGK